jgi:DNA-binding CsgD family transcriptional regulator
MKITPRTAASHKYSMMELLGVKSTAALTRFALRQQVGAV